MNRIDLSEPQETISFVVLGAPSPEGSTRAFYIPKLNKTVTTHQNQSALNAWRNRVATEAQNVLMVQDWTSDRSSAYTLPVHRRLRPTVKPDIDKLVRAINDALTGILFPDDCQVVSIQMTKEYEGERRPGAYLRVCRYQNVRDKRRKAKKKEVVEDDILFDPRDD